MIVLSLFDGMSCGQIALNRLGIPIDRYLASEVEPWAINVTQANYPKTEQLGNVSDIDYSDLPEIDLLLGGSPCQGFSASGKGWAFDDPRSELFFEFVWMLEETQPKYFLLENVTMKQEYVDIITEHLGVEPIKINSALVSAQNRERLYWTNIPNVGQPEDKGILLEDIIDYGYVDRDKSYCLDASYFKGADPNVYFERQIVFGALRGRKNDEGDYIQQFEQKFDGKSNTLTTVGKDNIVLDYSSYRMLTPVECERLQTVPENYTNHASDNQRIKMLGNGWTIDVIAHILKELK